MANPWLESYAAQGEFTPTKVAVNRKPSPKKRTGLEGFLVDNASTIGGVVGGIAGLPLGFVGGVAGASAGSALGQDIKNRLTRDDEVDESVLKAGLAGGAGQIAGGVIGKGLGKVGQFASGKLSKAATSTAGKKALTLEAEAKAPYAGVAKQIREGSIKGTSLKDVESFAKSLDMDVSPQSLATIHRTTTGANGAMSGTLGMILEDAPPIATGSALTAAKNAITKEAGNLGRLNVKGGAASNVLREVNDTLDSTLFAGKGMNLNRASGKLTDKAGANEVLDTIRELERKAAGKPMTDAGRAQANVLRATKQELEKSLYGNPQVDKLIKGFKLPAEDEQAIRAMVTKEGGTDKLANYIVDNLNNAKSAKQIRTAQRTPVAAGTLSEAAEKVAGGAVPKAPTGDGSALEGLGDLVMAPKNPYSLARTFGRAAGYAGDKAGEAAGALVGKGTALNQQLRTPGGLSGLLSAGAGQGMAQGTINPQSSAPVEEPPMEGADLAADNLGSIDMPEETPSVTTYTRENLVADISRDPKNASTYMSLYKTLTDEEGSQTTAAQKKAKDDAKAATGLIDEIESTVLAQPSGRVSGTVAKLAGKAGANDEVQAYEKQRQALALLLVKAVQGSAGQISDRDRQALVDAIPTSSDTSGEKKAKIRRLRVLVNAYSGGE